MENIDLESDRLLFKRLSKEHVTQHYLNWLNDPMVNKFLETKSDYTMEMLSSYVEGQYASEIYFWAIHLKNTGKHIGNIKIDPIDKATNSAEYGILMGDKSNWGKGFAKEASLRILNFCFKQLGLSRITLGVVEDNINAVKLYKKMGFTIKGIKKNIGIYDNKSCNSLRMSINLEALEQ